MPCDDSWHSRRPCTTVVTVVVADVEIDVVAVEVADVLAELVAVLVTVVVCVVYSQSRNRPLSHESIAVLSSVTSSSSQLVFTMPNGIWHEKAASGGPLLFPFILNSVTMAFRSFTTSLQFDTVSNETELCITLNVSCKFGFVPKF